MSRPQIHVPIDQGLDDWLRKQAYEQRLTRTEVARAVLLIAMLEDLKRQKAADEQVLGEWQQPGVACAPPPAPRGEPG